MKVVRVSRMCRIVCYFTIALVATIFLLWTCVELVCRWKLRTAPRSMWVIRQITDNNKNNDKNNNNGNNNNNNNDDKSRDVTTKMDTFISLPIDRGDNNKRIYHNYIKYSKVDNLYNNKDLELNKKQHKFDPSESHFIVPKGKVTNGAVYTKKLPAGNDVVYKKIGFFDPEKENQFLMKTDFNECEYSKCKMTGAKESADAMIFLMAKLKNVDVPKFKRKPEQYWILKSDEAPSRFSWFESLKRPGLVESMNWTLTHKADSDIPVFYGKLTKKSESQIILDNKDYSKIFDGKSKIAAWFVSHCPVRSRRGLYVDKMNTRIDVDIFGKCGTKTCGMAEKIPGVVGMRQQADKDTCFPMLSAHYFFYLAFENSLCQEYITEKFFKMFHEVDVIPVVRGGADYKKHFPPGSFVDASDFATPEMLADFLHDLALDKTRYSSYLKTKNSYQYLDEHPEWQCKLCEKIHTDTRKKTYADVHQWWTRNSCHDAMDSALFF